jgi:hypothetical protein
MVGQNDPTHSYGQQLKLIRPIKTNTLMKSRNDMLREMIS